MFGEIESGKDLKEVIEGENYDLPLKERIIVHIAQNKGVIVKSQQRDEPDLNYEERKEITKGLLEKSPSQFLYRFGKHLKREHLLYFNSFSKNDEMKFYLLEAQKQLNESTQRQKIKNRRFGALKKMELSGASFFKEEEMKKRDPLLWDELVDKNLTEEERNQKFDEARENASSPINTFSELLFEQIERNKVNARRREQEAAEDNCVEEEEEDDDDDVSEKEEEKESQEQEPLDEGQKSLLWEEFRTTMFSRFVSGKESDFDYSAIDHEEDNDLLEWETHDLEERYFDDDEPITLAVENDERMED